MHDWWQWWWLFLDMGIGRGDRGEGRWVVRGRVRVSERPVSAHLTFGPLVCVCVCVCMCEHF